MNGTAALVGGLCGIGALCCLPSAGGRLHRVRPRTVRRMTARRRTGTAPTLGLVRLLGRVSAGLRAGGSPPEVWSAVLGQCVSAAGVPTVQAVMHRVEPPHGSGTGHGFALRSTRRRRDRADAYAHAAGVIAACRVAAELGAPLAPILDQAVHAVEAEREAQAATDAALAGPEQTVRLLSWLPLSGVLLGVLVGAAPLAVLGDRGIGTGCLLLGGICALCGRLWIRRLVARTRAAGRPHVSTG